MRMILDFELNKVTYEGDVAWENVLDVPDLYKKKEQIYKVLGIEELTCSEINIILNECFKILLRGIEEE